MRTTAPAKTYRYPGASSPSKLKAAKARERRRSTKLRGFLRVVGDELLRVPRRAPNLPMLACC